MTVLISGARGVLRAGYQQAMEIGPWEMVPSNGTFTLTATVVSTHDYWSRLRPLALVVYLGTTEWMWPDVVVDRAGDAIVIELPGRPVVTQHRVTRGK